MASAAIVCFEPYFAFLKSIPWNFYALLSLCAIPMIIMGKDFGPMAKAEHRAETTGQLIADGASPMSSVEKDFGAPFTEKGSSIYNYLIHIDTLIFVGM